MKLQIAFVDDRKDDRERLEGALRRFFVMQKKHSADIFPFESAEEFLPAFEADKYHLAFFDIVMNDMTGIELARRVREIDPKILIVFQTTSREYAFDSFSVHPFDYLIKPWGDDELDGVLAEAIRILNINEPEITVSSSRNSFTVPLRSISSLSAQGHNLKLTLADGRTLICTDTFKNIKNAIGGDRRFLEINRGIIINMDEVVAPSEAGMKMKNGDVFPIKVNGRAAILSAFSQYMISRVEGR